MLTEIVNLNKRFPILTNDFYQNKRLSSSFWYLNSNRSTSEILCLNPFSIVKANKFKSPIVPRGYLPIIMESPVFTRNHIIVQDTNGHTVKVYSKRLTLLMNFEFKQVDVQFIGLYSECGFISAEVSSLFSATMNYKDFKFRLAGRKRIQLYKTSKKVDMNPILKEKQEQQDLISLLLKPQDEINYDQELIWDFSSAEETSSSPLGEMEIENVSQRKKRKVTLKGLFKETGKLMSMEITRARIAYCVFIRNNMLIIMKLDPLNKQNKGCKESLTVDYSTFWPLTENCTENKSFLGNCFKSNRFFTSFQDSINGCSICLLSEYSFFILLKISSEKEYDVWFPVLFVDDMKLMHVFRFYVQRDVINFSIQTTDDECFITYNAKNLVNLKEQEKNTQNCFRTDILKFKHPFDRNNAGYNLKRFGFYNY